MQKKTDFSPPSLIGYDFMNELMEKLTSIVSSRSGANHPEDVAEGEIWIKTETYKDEDDNELRRMTPMLRRNGEDVDIFGEREDRIVTEYFLDRVADATAEKVAGRLVMRDANGKAALDVDGNITGNATTANKLSTAREIKLKGDVTGSALFDGSKQIDITTKTANSVIPVGTICSTWLTDGKDPAGWFICNGRDLTTAEQAANPELVKILENKKKLPDLRGYFIRGFDGRAPGITERVDKNGEVRILRGEQLDAQRNITGKVGAISEGFNDMVQEGALYKTADAATDYLSPHKTDASGGGVLGIDAKRVVGATHTADEVRPINRALNYIIKGG
jgi:hypothetical protein